MESAIGAARLADVQLRDQSDVRPRQQLGNDWIISGSAFSYTEKRPFALASALISGSNIHLPKKSDFEKVFSIGGAANPRWCSSKLPKLQAACRLVCSWISALERKSEEQVLNLKFIWFVRARPAFVLDL